MLADSFRFQKPTNAKPETDVSHFKRHQHWKIDFTRLGNNGNCFNKNINDVSCTGTFSQQLRDNLYNFSDHLPVVMELQTPQNLSIKDETYQNISFSGSNITNSYLLLNFTDDFYDSELLIYNTLGKIVKKFPIYFKTISNKNINIDVQNLSNGIYFIKNSKIILTKPLKFIKN